MSRSQTIGVWVLAVVAMLFFLRSASQLLIPIVLGILLSYALEPIVTWLERHRVPRLAGASIVLAVILGACGWGLYSLKDNVTDAIKMLPRAAERVQDMLTSEGGSGAAASITEAARVMQGEDSGGQPQTEAGASPSATTSGQGTASSSVLGAVQWGVGSVVALAGNLTVVVFLIFFLLLSGNHVQNRIVEISGPDRDRQRVARTIVKDINAQIQRFLLVRLITAVIVGIATWSVLAWLGVDNAPVWGILAGVFNSIPYFGPIIVSGGLLVVGLVQGDGTAQALQMSGAALVITSLEGWLLTPPLMGKAERMGVLAVFLGLLLWTWIWGAWGTILAVPMLVVIKSVADHVPSLKPVGRLLAP